MRILLATDSFPPRCGGSGWSTFELARGLRDLGHEITVVQPVPGRPDAVDREHEGFRVRRVGCAAPDVPYVRNYLKNERLTRLLAPRLVRIIETERIDVAHGQHVLTCPATVSAAREAGIPVVCTVRDYWPVCYWSDLIHDLDADSLCPACTPGMMTRCVRPRAGPLWPLALPMIPYMRRNLGRKRVSLARADAVIAVSSAIARDLRARAPELRETRIEIIPNPLDVAGLRAAAGPPAGSTSAVESDAASTAVPYAIYVGKLAPNKGVHKLMDAVERARLDWPLVVVGDGPSRRDLESRARASDVDVTFTGWLDRAEGLRRLAGAALLVFPSHGPESLSRVLLEASALGVPIAAMDTGGSADIVADGETGLLVRTADELGDAVARLRADEALRRRLGRAARERVASSFDAPAVVRQVAELYRSTLAGSTP